jgi:putative addiction module killer protein
MDDDKACLMIEVRRYIDSRGLCPFDKWLSGLKDRAGAARIQVRIDRLGLGLEGDWKAVGDGVRELRIPTGPGYRVYYAWDGPMLVLLLCAGDKSTQARDIGIAIDFWRDYRGQ